MMNSSPRLIKIEKGYQLVDSESGELNRSRLQRVINQYQSYFLIEIGWSYRLN